jgi:hypothetical protein
MLGDHSRPLGICWIVYGLVRIAMAIFLAAFGGTATLMFGALLNRVADPFTLMGAFHFIYVVAVILSAACGVAGLAAGFALLTSGRSARTLCMIASFLSLPNIPLGTTLGIYTLILCVR